jgi:fucose 4-O-acetylase-like acetyltransferase
MTQRIVWVDIFRGLAIIAIVIGHSGTPTQIHHFVYSFHIAAFFFISGYIFNPQKDLTVLIVDRAKRLLVPYFSYNLLFFSLFIILKIFQVDTFFYGSSEASFSILMAVAAPFTGMGWFFMAVWAPLAGMGWFLWTLFETTICSAIIIKIFHKCRINHLFLFLPMLALFFLGVTISYPLYHPLAYGLNPVLSPPFDINLASIPYFLLGFLAQYYKVFKRKQLILYLTPVLMLVVYYLAWRYDSQVDFVFRNFLKWPYSIPVSFAAFGCFFSFSVLSESFGWLRRLLVFIGKRTLPIMCLHLFVFRITRLLLYLIGMCPVTILSTYGPPPTEYFWIAYTISAIGICLLISNLMEKNRYLRFLFLGLPDAETVKGKCTKILVWLVLVLYVGIFLYVWNKGSFDYEGLKMMIGY